MRNRTTIFVILAFILMIITIITLNVMLKKEKIELNEKQTENNTRNFSYFVVGVRQQIGTTGFCIEHIRSDPYEEISFTLCGARHSVYPGYSQYNSSSEGVTKGHRLQKNESIFLNGTEISFIGLAADEKANVIVTR